MMQIHQKNYGVINITTLKEQISMQLSESDEHYRELLDFHDLRHEATSRLFEKGLNPVEVATITGSRRRNIKSRAFR